MKTKTQKTLILIFVTSIALQMGCSKERIQPKQLTQYNSPTAYLDSKKEQEQEFIITSDSGGPIIGNQGTKLYGSRQCLMFPNGDSVPLPFTVKLVELYGAKQMIYYQMPTVAGGTILKTDGEIRYRAFKNGTELVLKPNPCFAAIEMPNPAPQPGMRVFYGFDASGRTDWTDNLSSLGITSSVSPDFTTNSYGYAASIGRLGWINCGQKAGGSSNYKLNFASTVDDLTNVAIFIYLPATKTVMQVYSLVSTGIPSGSTAKIVCIAVDGNNTLYSFSKTLTASSDTQIDVTMAATTDTALTDLLTNL